MGSIHRWGVVGLLAAVVIGAAGCGSDDGGGEGLAVGDPAPPFSLPSARGSDVSLADFDGPVLLYFHMADG
jgi:hypothetical protein